VKPDDVSPYLSATDQQCSSLICQKHALSATPNYWAIWPEGPMLWKLAVREEIASRAYHSCGGSPPPNPAHRKHVVRAGMEDIKQLPPVGIIYVLLCDPGHPHVSWHRLHETTLPHCCTIPG
jgi:hypothetical protein